MNLGSSVTKATPGKPSSLVSSSSNILDLVTTACSLLLGARVLYTVVTPSLIKVLWRLEDVTELLRTWGVMMKPSLAGRMTTLLGELGVNVDNEVGKNLQITKYYLDIHLKSSLERQA